MPNNVKTTLNGFSLAAVALALAACGGASIDSPTAPTPVLKASTAQSGGQQQVAADYYPMVQRLYVGYFGRPADPAGMEFFAQGLLAAGAPTALAQLVAAYDGNAQVHALVDVFSASAESHALYSGDNDAFLTAIYHNLYNREADADGKVFWLKALDSGAITRANAALAIMAGARSDDVQIVTGKALAASTFTSSLDTPQKVAAYSGLAASAEVRNWLGQIGMNTDAGTLQAGVMNMMLRLVTSWSNTPPYAYTGGPQLVTTGSFVGIGLPPATGNALGYSWTLVSKPSLSSAVLKSATSSIAVLRPDVAGDYVVSLVVTNGTLASAPAEVTISAITPL